LETRYPTQPLPSQPTQAIVVLSSAIDPPIRERPFPLPDKDTYKRCRFAAWLHTNWKPLPVLACGGPGLKSQQPLSATMRRLLVEGGVPEAMVWTETRSRSTHENAVFASEILRQHGIARIALVVEAQSMPRAEACFRKEGLIVVPAPCDFRQFGSPLEELIPSWKSVQRNETTLHEALGLAWYRLRGWI
jgi:uncharacterized SAM-binding protein YcdF (DUF218 family)